MRKRSENLEQTYKDIEVSVDQEENTFFNIQIADVSTPSSLK